MSHLGTVVNDPIGPIDPLLTKIVGATPTADSERSLERLVTDHAVPIIDSVVRRRCGRWRGIDGMADDVRSEVVIRLMNRLRTISTDASAAPISSFRDYVAVVTSRAVDDLMRRHFPRRAQLKNRVRYLLRHDHRFVWTTNGDETMCVLADVPAEPVRSRLRAAHSSEVEALAHQVIGILDQTSPCELDTLVNAVAAATGVVDEHWTSDAWLNTAAAVPDPLKRIETMESLRCLWSEIAALPPKQRAALLLNLRDADGDSPLALLPTLGIASIREIARTVGLADDAFFALWNELPLKDAEIAERLSLNRQQVINLRKSARDRLNRRMARLQHTSER